MLGSAGGADSKFDTEIIGVVGDTKHSAVRDQMRADRLPGNVAEPQLNYVTYLTRTWQSPRTAEAGIRAAMQQLDPKLALSDLQPMEQQVIDSLSE